MKKRNKPKKKIKHLAKQRIKKDNRKTATGSTRRISIKGNSSVGGRVGMPRYTLNRDFEFVQELRDLILKSSPAEKEEITARLLKLGKIKLAVIAGVFLNKENPEGTATDLFIVSDDLDRKKFNPFLRYLEAETGGEIRFVVMEKDEFMYRLSMFDRFVRVLLEGPHEKLINKLGL